MITWTNNLAKLSIPTPFPVGDVNVYLIKQDDYITLVDAGPKTEIAWDAFQQQLREIELSPNDIDQVVITHHHPDHVGLLDFFRDDIPIIGHPFNERWLHVSDTFLKEHDEFYTKLFNECGLPEQYADLVQLLKRPLRFTCNRSLTKRVVEGDEIYGLKGWKVIETHGHAQGHIALYHADSSTLIGGDHILATISSNPLLEPPFQKGEKRPKPMLQYNQSLQKLLQYNIELIYSGHGNEVKFVNRLIERRLNRQDDRAMYVKSMLAEQPLTAFEVCQKLFPAIYEQQLGLTLSETIGQLDYLLDLGAIKYEVEENGSLLYHTVG